MGSSLGPLLANIWMAHLEEELIVKSMIYPSFYRRYVDDTFCLFSNKAQADDFLDSLNSLDPSTKFDLETDVDDKLAFLDTIVSRNVNSLYPNISTRVKPTDKGLFYHFSSFIPDVYKSNLVSSLIYRIFHIATDYIIFSSDVQVLVNKLVKNGFPRSFIDHYIGIFLNRVYTPKTPVSTVPLKTVVMVLPFLGPMSLVLKRKLSRLVCKFYPTVQLKVVFKRGFRISNLFSFKDKLPLKCSSGVVYYTQCCKCGPSEAYVGKTINTLYERFFGSNGHLNPHTQNSSLFNHIWHRLEIQTVSLNLRKLKY